MATHMSLRQHLLSGGKSYGTMLLSNSPIVAELMASMGYSHLILDHEHCPTDVASGQQILQAIRAAQSKTEPIVRVPSANDPVYMKKVLDSLRLPAGLLVPMVNDAATAEAVVKSIRYPRQLNHQNEVDGIRGCAVPFVRASGWGMEDDYMKRCHEDLIVMVQVETPQGVAAIDEIADVEGIDLIFLGPMDLSCSIGKMGQFDDPEVKGLITKAERTIQRNPKVLLGGFRPPGRDLGEMFGDSGYSLVCGSVDMGLLREAAQVDVALAGKLTNYGI